MTPLIFGFLFGAILQCARLNRFDTISGMATLENYQVAKAIALAIGVGAIIFNIEVGMGLATYHVKPFLTGGLVMGGLIFGTGMAILGYCPGTVVISAGEGSLDALVGMLGGLVAGVTYTAILPGIGRVIGPDLGAISLHTALGASPAIFYPLMLVAGLAFIAVAFLVHRLERSTDKTWIIAGVGLALLNAVVSATAVADHPIGASASFPYLADTLCGVTNNPYFKQITKPGHWELIFLMGAMLSGLVISLVRKEFKLRMIHANWAKRKGTGWVNRAAWAFVGGFLLIGGARMAGGCTSGHVISGGMQLAASSFTFAIFVFAGLLTTGRFFYPAKN